jgi:hypothetical protein
MGVKFKWQRNNWNGFTLMVLRKGYSYESWNGRADVFKAKRGDRWVARWIVTVDEVTSWQQGNALTLREAMRLAKYMTGVHHGD